MQPITNGAALAAFLRNTFPWIAASPDQFSNSPLPSVLAQPSILDQGPWHHVADALGVVSDRGELGRLQARCAQTHREKLKRYTQQHWMGLVDCLAEACAFAWANEHLGAPTFTSAVPQYPDVLVRPNDWVEAKSIWTSDVHRASWAQRRTSGQIQARIAEGPNYLALVKKFEDQYDKARSQLAKRRPDVQIIYVSVMGLDTEAILDDDGATALGLLQRRADRMCAAHPDVGLIMSYKFDWRQPWYRYLPTRR